MSETTPFNSAHNFAPQSMDSRQASSYGLGVDSAIYAKEQLLPTSAAPPRQKRSNKKLIIAAIALLVIAAAIAIPVGVVVSNNKKHKSSSSSSENSDSNSGSNTGSDNSGSSSDDNGFANTNPSVKSGAWRGNGTDGSEMIQSDGSSFIYVNNLGGTWDAVPFSDTARAQSDVPALNETWDYAKLRISGVNLGGWITLEPFIVPALFEPYENSSNPAVDEWTLCEILGDKKAEVIENHYKTFITEKDIADIASAGLNWVRLPIPWWVIEVWDGEPFLERVGWTYVLKAFEWCRKYGIRVNLDLHAVPGSQNGNNHSGRLGSVGFLNGAMGIANAQRTINYIRTLTEFVSQPQYVNVVQMFSVVNEPKADVIGVQIMKQFYLHTYRMVRDISGIGIGKGPAFVLDRGFVGQDQWYHFMEGSDRVFLDHHPYFAFTPSIINQGLSLAQYANLPCVTWGGVYNETFREFGFAFVGEMSLAINDCGKYINSVGQGTRYEATLSSSPSSVRQGSCDVWDNYWEYSDDTKQGLKNVASAFMDMAGNFFFWTWKIGNSSVTNAPINPFWSYSLGLQYNYIPQNPREALGFCQTYPPAHGATAPNSPWPGTFSGWQTGGVGAGTIAPSQTTQYDIWPPTSISGYSNAKLLPTYTATGPVVTQPASTPTASPKGYNFTAGDGWEDDADNAGWYVQNPACQYYDPWGAANAAPPTSPRCPS